MYSDQRQPEQDGADDRGAGEVAEAGDQAVGERGQDGVLAGDQGRVAEVLEDVDRHQQDAADQAGPRQGQRDGAEDGPRIGAQVARGLLEARVGAGQDVGDELVGVREEGDGLDAPQAVEPEDVRALAEDVVGDRSRADRTAGCSSPPRRTAARAWAAPPARGRTASRACGCRPWRRRRRSRAGPPSWC